MGDSMKESLALIREEKTSSSHLVDRINVVFEIYFCILSKVNLPLIKIRGQLPSLNINFSDLKYKTLLKVVDLILPNNQSNPEVVQAVASAPRNIYLEEQVPIIEDDDAFYDAEENISEKDLHLHKKQFVFEFRIDKLHALICEHEKSNNSDKKLVDAVLEGFEISVETFPYCFTVELLMNKINVYDLMDGDEFKEFSHFLTSEMETNHETSNNKLMNILYTSVSELSPEFYSVYKGINQKLDVSFNNFNLVVTQKSILSLYYYILKTFVPDNENPTSNDKDKNLSTENGQDLSKSLNNSIILINAHIDFLRVVLNDSNHVLATINLKSTNIDILVSDVLKFDLNVGNFGIIDNIGSADSLHSFRQLFTIEGDEVIKISYETISDLEKIENLKYDSSLKIRLGSGRLTFVEETLRQLSIYFSNFADMHILFETARLKAIESASQIQERANRMHYDILVNTPYIIFPRSSNTSDILVANLGELKIINHYENHAEFLDKFINNIKLEVNSIKLSSNLYFGTIKQTMQIINDVDINILVKYCQFIEDDHSSARNKPSIPELNVVGSVSDVHMHLTRAQYSFVLFAVNSVLSLLSSDDNPAQKTTTEESKTYKEETSSFTAKSEQDILFTKLHASFKLKNILLELFDGAQNQSKMILNSKLVKILIKDLGVDYSCLSNSVTHIESNIRQFVVTDTRSGNKKEFRDILFPRSLEDIQLKLKLKQDPFNPSDLNVKLISPKIILAIDYLYSIKDFALSPFEEDAELQEHAVKSQPRKKNDLQKEEKTSQAWMFRIEIVETEVILLKDMKDLHCEAISLNIAKIVLSQYGIFSLSINNVGMSLCQLNVSDGFSLKFIENFDVLLSMDQRYEKPGHDVTNIVVDVKPITLRASYRDILIITQVLNKIYELFYSSNNDSLEENKLLGDTKDSNNIYASMKRTSNNIPYRVLSRESLKANFQGIEIIIIKDIIDLPVIDIVLEGFSVNVNNWTNQLTADTQISMFSNIFNVKSSHWEPLIERWKFGINMFRASTDDTLKMELGSRQLLDINVTPSVVSTIMSVYDECMLNNPLTTPRGSHIPYIIKNRTGLPMHIWSDSSSLDSSISTVFDGEDKPWRFNDWKESRETKSKETNTINIQFENIPLESIKNINVDKQGQTIFHLRPKLKNTTHQLLCRVILENNVKCVVFSSPLIIKNLTTLDLELVVVNQRNIWMDEYVVIKPNNEYSISMNFVYDHGFLIRPSSEFAYQWSNNKVFWGDLFKEKSKYYSLCCFSQENNNSTFWMKIKIDYDDKNKRSVYPNAIINIYPPIEIENILPYKMKIKLKEVSKNNEWNYCLEKGEKTSIHVVDTSSYITLYATIEDAGFNSCEPVIITSPNGNRHERSNKIILYDSQRLPLTLKLNYSNMRDNKDGLRMTIYCPYILLNKTGLKMLYKTKNSATGEKSVAGQTNNLNNSKHPFMFSYGASEGNKRARVKIEDSEWSNPISFEAVGSTSELSLKSKLGFDEIYIGIKIEQGHGKYCFSKFVTFTPRFIMINDTIKTIQTRELGSSKVTKIMHGERVPLNFIRQSNEKQLTISYPGIKNQWSAPFKIDTVGKTYVTLRKYKQQKEADLIKIDIILEGSVLFLVFKDETTWPFEIINESSYELKFFQGDELAHTSSAEQLKYILPPKSKTQYTWDYPSAKKKFLLIDMYGSFREISFMEVGSLVPFKFKHNGKTEIISIDVVSEGPVLSVKINNYQQSKSLYKIKVKNDSAITSKTVTVSSMQNFEVIEKDMKTLFSFIFTLKGIGISLIDETDKEIVYITMRNINIKYDDSNLSQTINCNVKWIQIDNQMYECIYPILLYPSVVPNYGQELDRHPFFQLVVIKSKDNSYGVEFYKYFTFLMQELNIEADEDFLYVLSDFTKHISSLITKELHQDESDDLFKTEMEIPELENLDSNQQTFFEVLHIQPIKLNLSFTRKDSSKDDVSESTNPLNIILKIFTTTIGSINDAPIKLNALMLENVLLSYPLLYDRVYNYYSQEVIFQFHKIIGSADFIGNPVGLFNNVSSGVVDMFYEPYQGFILDGPQDLGIGLARGTASFVKKTVYGVSDSFHKITQSLGKGLSVATMDKAYQDRRTSMVRNKPKHAFYGVAQGGYSFATSLVSGISGVVTQPIRGAEKEGIGGFFKGFGKGMVGVVTKPVIGVFDLASSVTEGIRNSTTAFDNNQIDRCRPPRHIKRNGILTKYDPDEALGQLLLYQIKYGRYYKEGYLGHFDIKSTRNMILVTSLRCLMIKPKSLGIEWEVHFSGKSVNIELKSIDSEPTGIYFMLHEGIPGPFIPVTERNKKDWLFVLIKKSFDEYVRLNKDMD